MDNFKLNTVSDLITKVAYLEDRKAEEELNRQFQFKSRWNHHYEDVLDENGNPVLGPSLYRKNDDGTPYIEKKQIRVDDPKTFYLEWYGRSDGYSRYTPHTCIELGDELVEALNLIWKANPEKYAQNETNGTRSLKTLRNKLVKFSKENSETATRIKIEIEEAKVAEEIARELHARAQLVKNIQEAVYGRFDFEKEPKISTITSDELAAELDKLYRKILGTAEEAPKTEAEELAAFEAGVDEGYAQVGEAHKAKKAIEPVIPAELIERDIFNTFIYKSKRSAATFKVAEVNGDQVKLAEIGTTYTRWTTKSALEKQYEIVK